MTERNTTLSEYWTPPSQYAPQGTTPQTQSSPTSPTPPQYPPTSAPYYGTPLTGQQTPTGQQPPVAPQQRTRRPAGRGVRRTTAVLLVLVAFLLGLVSGYLGSLALETDSTSAASSTEQSSSATIQVLPDGSVAAVAAAAMPSTVYIEATTAQASSTGTGMVLRSDGYIVTNNHVIEGDGVTITVTFSDGTEEPATVVAATSDYDLAVLKVDRDDLVPLTLADSDQVVIGDTVVAVGAPLGLEGTVTSGIVSALNRPVTAGSTDEVSFINAIQTDAAINPGNSGGPLLNLNGEVIGINSAIAQASNTTSGSIGLGFAIPSNQVSRTTTQLIEDGYATYPIIGALLDGNYTGEGVLVAQDQPGQEAVTSGGPADDAGLEPGDIIMSIDGNPMTSSEEVIVYIRAQSPGDVVELDVQRGDTELTLSVTLGEQKAD